MSETNQANDKKIHELQNKNKNLKNSLEESEKKFRIVNDELKKEQANVEDLKQKNLDQNQDFAIQKTELEMV